MEERARLQSSQSRVSAIQFSRDRGRFCIDHVIFLSAKPTQKQPSKKGMVLGKATGKGGGKTLDVLKVNCGRELADCAKSLTMTLY